MRCTGQLVTKKEGNYKFFLSSDDGSVMWLNGEKVVDNDGCHGEEEQGSSDKFLLPGAHDLAVDMCEYWGGEVLKMRYQGPDSGNSKITIPGQALQHVVDGKANMETVTQQVTPVCSTWQLRIAEDNSKGWEAHIFEIELFNDDDLISGPGKGTASSDCKNWAGGPEGAFDGDLSTKWVTCSGAAKVGKSITTS
ncbi:unnamed protein product [Symbiodinium natans]|uniref:PA14 domain-containing protein n=1 Tax=Symbiodinium natans TaxID=878477 RepID=A0A812G651_9DINO|nr:unnamed protein product [Symbiodinium natans]